MLNGGFGVGFGKSAELGFYTVFSVLGSGLLWRFPGAPLRVGPALSQIDEAGCVS